MTIIGTDPGFGYITRDGELIGREIPTETAVKLRRRLRRMAATTPA